ILSEGRNIALLMYECLAPHFFQFRTDFHASLTGKELDCDHFVHLLNHYIRGRSQQTLTPFAPQKIFEEIAARFAEEEAGAHVENPPKSDFFDEEAEQLLKNDEFVQRELIR